MKYMLDTNICIYIIKNKPDSVRRKFSTLFSGDVCISSVTYFELEKGVRKSQQRVKNQTLLSRFVEDVVVAPFDDAASRCAAEVGAQLESKGLGIGPYDTLIAGHGLSLGLVLVTNNLKEFERVSDLQFENWV